MWSSVPENGNSFNFKWYGAETLVANLSGTGNFTTVGDVAVNGGDLTTTASTFNLIDANATTVNFAGAATALTLGATSGTTNIKNNLDVDLTLNARDINNTVIGNVTPAAATFTNVTDESLTATRVTFAGTGGDLTDSANFTFASNILTVKNFSINGDTAEISVIGGSGNVILNPDSGGVIDATNSLISNVANPVSGQDVVTLSYLNTELSSNVSLISENNTDITITDTGTGIITANVDAVSVLTITSSSASFYNDLVTVDGNLAVNGIATLNNLTSVTDTTISTAYNNGAFQVDGGVGVGGNISVKLGQQITVGVEDPSANISFPERQMILIANANVASGINVRNLSSEQGATSNYIAIADNNAGDDHIVVLGIASSNFDNGSAVKANDAYLFTNGGVSGNGGNLHITTNSQNGAIYLTVGSNEENKVATVGNSNVAIVKHTISTSTSTGALTVKGGVGIGGNIWIANGAVINDSQSSDNFTVKGKVTSSLIYADSTYGAVVIGGSNASPQLGATLKVNSNDSILLPVGATADRPSNSGNVDVAGMLRFNSSINSVEFYTGTTWAAAGSDTTFTIITNQQFNGNGTANTYALSSSTTTNGTIVSINGILQIPTLAYSITGNTLVFTENPADGDIIDVRVLSTTQTVGDVSSVDGLNSFTPDNANGAAIYSGTTVLDKTIRATAKPDGTWAYVNGTKTTYDQTAVATSTTITVIDSFPVSDYSSAKYIVQTKNGSDIESMEALVVATSTEAYITTFGIVASNVSLGSLTANVVSGNVRLYYNTALTNSNVKVYTTYIV
jgi:hypothetical protein